MPYAGLFGAAGGTDLKVRESWSNFTFLVFGGVGAEVFLTYRTALYAGFPLQHVSHGNTSSPNRGFPSQASATIEVPAPSGASNRYASFSTESRRASMVGSPTLPTHVVGHPDRPAECLVYLLVVEPDG